MSYVPGVDDTMVVGGDVQGHRCEFMVVSQRAHGHIVVIPVFDALRLLECSQQL